LRVTGSFSRMRLANFSLLLALAFTTGRALGAASCLPADGEALQWLDKMSRSLQQISYHGVVTFQRGDDMQAMQVSHIVTDGVATDRLTELTGQGAEVVRTGHPLECVHPGLKLLQAGALKLGGDCGIAEYYRFSVAPGELVAGREAVRIHIEPRDMYRYGYIMELDRETGLLLRSETLGRGDKVLEKFQFASLSYSPEVDSINEARVVHQAQHPHPDERELTVGAGPLWAVKWLPQGFTATDALTRGADRQTFTDGLAVFSVFLEMLSGDIRPGEGVVRTGGTTSYTRGMDLDGHSVLVTVIGEVPLNTARMVADSVVDLQ
jgi:sigma-E factor negative regulatory protein RseB